MREITVNVRFTRACLGNVKDSHDGRFRMPRTPDGSVMFLQTWHQSNMRMAAELLGRHQSEVEKILWDVAIVGQPGRDGWYKRYYSNGKGRQRFVLHEAFLPGRQISINCAVPDKITDDDMLQLMRIAGRYVGLSPYMPKDYGRFDVESIMQRRRVHAPQTAEPIV